MVLAIALIWLPNGIDDIITLPILITLFGFKVYLTIAFILIGVILFNFNKIKPLINKPNGSEAERVCKKLYETEKDINVCIKKNAESGD